VIINYNIFIMSEEKTKKGNSTTAIAVQRLKEKQLNIVFGALTYDELKRVKSSLETAIKSKIEEEKSILIKKLKELENE
jgi:hypothetical protein